MGEDDFDMDETKEVEGQLFNLENLSWPNVPTFSWCFIQIWWKCPKRSASFCLLIFLVFNMLSSF